ncbi:MAG: FliI/YscN family ATPase [Neomegalonema sp.]|nr:FliI/YscN family ATPase [Neomegalonema sp.]
MRNLETFEAAARRAAPVRISGRATRLGDARFDVSGLDGVARIGDAARLLRGDGGAVEGEVIALTETGAVAMAYEPIDGAAIGDRVQLDAKADPTPGLAWLGHVVDADGRPLGGRKALPIGRPAPLRAQPPNAIDRKAVGARLSTGHAAFDTMLPLCRGQRVGVFAGSGVGKSRLMGALAQRMSADVVVIGLIGERGREVRDFIDNTLGAEALKRAVVVAATSDQPAAVKRRASWLTLAVAERFRDEGKHVLLLFDSLTRFAEAHREIALTGGETASLRGFPPSTGAAIAGLCERAGPGPDGVGDITAVFTVLVAGSDMDEPVADMTRGVLDGHVVLSRNIAERGRFPAIDMRRSVSRSLPDAATPAENELISRARRVLAAYEEAEPMIQIGLYRQGSDPSIDEAIRIWPQLDAFFAARSDHPEGAFEQLAEILGG